MFRFEEKKHKYWHSDVELPSVTTVIGHVLDPYSGYPSNPEYLAYKGRLGTAVHKAIELDLRGELDPESVQGVVIPYFNAWLQAKRDFNIKTICTEKRLYNRTLGIAGTVDMRAEATIKGVKRRGTIDFKTSNSQHEHYRYQVQWYEILWYNPGGTMMEPYPRKDLHMMRNLEMTTYRHTQLALPKELDIEFKMILYLKDTETYRTDLFEGYEHVDKCLEILHEFHRRNGGWNPDEVQRQADILAAKKRAAANNPDVNDEELLRPSSKSGAKKRGRPKKSATVNRPAKKPTKGELNIL